MKLHYPFIVLPPRDRLIMSRRFVYAIDKRYLPLLLPLGLRGSKDGVTLTDEGSLLATFGLIKIKTPLANVTQAHITRNYRWWTAFGVRASMVDDGLSFGTNHSAGVCIHFAQRCHHRGVDRPSHCEHQRHSHRYEIPDGPSRNPAATWCTDATSAVIGPARPSGTRHPARREQQRQWTGSDDRRPARRLASC
jgi:hypothetical protein